MNFKNKTQNFPPVKNNLDHQIQSEKNQECEKDVKTKKIKKEKIWKDTYKLQNITFPESIKASERLKKKYKIHIQYLDENNVKHNKTIRFGKHGKEDYLDNKNENQKKKLTSKLCNTHNLFHENYWRLNLLNTTDDLKSNYFNLLNKIKV